MFIKPSINALLWQLSQSVCTINWLDQNLLQSQFAVTGSYAIFNTCSLFSITGCVSSKFYFDDGISCASNPSNYSGVMEFSQGFGWAGLTNYPCANNTLKLNFPVQNVVGTVYTCNIRLRARDYDTSSQDESYLAMPMTTQATLPAGSNPYCATLESNTQDCGTKNYDITGNQLNIGSSLYNFGTWATPYTGSTCSYNSYAFFDTATASQVSNLLVPSPQYTTQAHQRVDILLSTSDTTLNGLTKTYSLKVTIGTAATPSTFTLCNFTIRYGCIVGSPTISNQQYRIGEQTKIIPHILASEVMTFGSTCNFSPNPFSITDVTGPPNLIAVDGAQYTVYSTNDLNLAGVHTVVLWIEDQFFKKHQLETLNVTFVYPCGHPSNTLPCCFITQQPNQNGIIFSYSLEIYSIVVLCRRSKILETRMLESKSLAQQIYSCYLDQRTIYLGQKETSMAHFDISQLQYTNNCFNPPVLVPNDKVDGDIFDPSSTWLSITGLEYTLKNTQNTADLGLHDVAFEILNSDSNQLVSIESFQVNILDPCVHATINPQQLQNFYLVVGTAQTKKISPWTYTHRSADGTPIKSDYACGALKMELELKDAIFKSLVTLNADMLKIDTTSIQDDFNLAFLTNSSHQVCVKVSLPAYANTVQSHKDCFTLVFTKPSTSSSNSYVPDIKVNQVIASGQTKHNPFSENTYQPNVTSCRPLSVASVILACGYGGNLTINWQAVQDLGLFESTLQVAFEITSVLEPGVIRSIVVDLSLPAENKLQEETLKIDFSQVTLGNVHEIFEEMQEMQEQVEVEGNSLDEKIAGKLVGHSAGLSEVVAKLDYENEDNFFFNNGNGLPEFNDTEKSPMRARIEYVSTNGTLSAQFNQRTVFPHWFIDVVNFFSNKGQLQRMSEDQRNLQICEEPCPQGSIKHSQEVLGFVEKFKEKPLLELGIYIRQFEHPEHSNEELLRYTWKVVRVNNETSTLYIKLDFEHPLEFSATSEPEYVKLYFNYPAYFESITGSVLETEYAIKRIPQQVTDQTKCDRLKNFGTAAADILAVAFSGSLIINWILLVSLSLLWNLLNTMQYVVFLPLAEVNYPANAMMLNSVLLQIANFDIIPCVKILEKIFTFGPQHPFSRSHENFGNDSHAMILNMGTNGMIFLLSLTIVPLFQIGFYYLDRHYGDHYNWIRRASAKFKAHFQYAFYLRMFLEVYQDISIGALVNLYDINRVYSSNVQFSGDIMSSLLAVLATILIAIVPFYLWTVLLVNRDKLQEQDFDSRYGELTHQYRSKRYYSSIIFMFRRLLTALILVCLRGYSYFQLIFLCYLQTAYIMFLCLAKPEAQKKANRREVQAEILTMFCIYHLFFFSDWVTTISATTAYNCGWTQCILIGIILILGIYQIVKDTIKTIKQKRYHKELARLRKLAAQHGITIKLSSEREANHKTSQQRESKVNNELDLENDSELQQQVESDENQRQNEQVRQSNPQLISAKLKPYNTRSNSKEYDSRFTSILPSEGTNSIANLQADNNPVGIDVLEHRFGASQLAIKIMNKLDSSQLESLNEEEEMKVVVCDSSYKRDQKGSPIRTNQQAIDSQLQHPCGMPQSKFKIDIHCENDLHTDDQSSGLPAVLKRAKPLWQVRFETTLDKLKPRTVVDFPALKDSENV